jgi:hypothetical protein
VSENAVFVHDLQVNFERILTAYEIATDGLSRKVRELLAKNRRLREKNLLLRAELERTEHAETMQISGGLSG